MKRMIDFFVIVFLTSSLKDPLYLRTLAPVAVGHPTKYQDLHEKNNSPERSSFWQLVSPLTKRLNHCKQQLQQFLSRKRRNATYSTLKNKPLKTMLNQGIQWEWKNLRPSWYTLSVRIRWSNHSSWRCLTWVTGQGYPPLRSRWRMESAGIMFGQEVVKYGLTLRTLKTLGVVSQTTLKESQVIVVQVLYRVMLNKNKNKPEDDRGHNKY